MGKFDFIIISYRTQSCYHGCLYQKVCQTGSQASHMPTPSTLNTLPVSRSKRYSLWPASVLMCMCVCMYACGCMYICVWMCTCVCMCVFVCVHMCLYVYTCIRMCACVCVHMCLHACTCVCVHAHVFACVHMCLYVCTCVCMHAHVFLCVHMGLYVCTYPSQKWKSEVSPLCQFPSSVLSELRLF